MEFIDNLRQLTFFSMILRIVLAMFLGGIVGMERERKRRAAGFRTYMLVALGSALTVMLGQYLSLMMDTSWADVAAQMGAKTDVVRFAAQVINGVGFLGAGTILVTGKQEVKGLTTAAGLWASACMGIAIGAGFYECMLVGGILLICCMSIMPTVEKFLMDRARNMNIFLELDSLESMGTIISRIKSEGIKLYDVDIDKDNQMHISEFSILLSVGLPKKKQHAEVLAMLSALEGVVAIDEA